MRRTLPDQLELVPAFHTHVRSRELEAMSQVLDAHPEASKWVPGDLVGQKVSSQEGRQGMSGDQVLRVLLVKQLGSFSYEELAFHLADSASDRAFCRIGSMEKLPTSKTLQRNVKKVEAITLERINVLLVEHAIAAEIEVGNKIGVDCTVWRPTSMTRVTPHCSWIRFASWCGSWTEHRSTSMRRSQTIIVVQNVEGSESCTHARKTIGCRWIRIFSRSRTRR